MDRRTFVLGTALAGLVLPTHASAATSEASRSFRIVRAGSDIGEHTLAAKIGSGGFEIAITIDIRVRFLGITAYRYTLANREVWVGGQLMRLDSTVNDDGTDYFAKVRRAGDALEIDGTSYSGTAPGEAATTSYYAPAFLERRPWISTQSGKPLDIDVTPASGGGFQVSGELETRLFYDGDDWAGAEFDASGQLASYETLETHGSIAALWSAA